MTTLAQAKRRNVEPPPTRNTGKAFSPILRYAAWVIFIFIPILLPMGVFTDVLAPD